MAEMDQGIKRLLQQHAAEIIAYLVPGAVYQETLATDLAMEPQRVTDTLYRVQVARGQGIINLEAQAKMRPPKLEDFHEYADRAHHIYRLPVWSIIVHLIPDGRLPNPPLLNRFGPKLVTAWWYQPVRLYHIPARSILRKRLTALAPLVPLMQGADLAVAQQAMQMIGHLVPEPERQSDAMLLAVFVARQFGTEIARGLLREVAMNTELLDESPLYREWVASAEAQGEARGIGIGREEGEARARVEMIHEAWQERFGVVPSDVEQALMQSDVATISRVHKALVQPATTMEQVRSLLGLA